MPHGNTGKQHTWTKVSEKRPSISDIAWAAGFFEGEGSCRRNNKLCADARIGQKNKEPVERMLRLFGGSLKNYKPKSLKSGSIWTWAVGGSRARGFLMTIYPFLSERRQKQARLSLGVAD